MQLPDADRMAELAARRSALRTRLGAEIERGGTALWTDAEFNELALEIFRYQAVANRVYGAFVRNRGLDPDGVEDWREIPPVPTRAFKELPPLCDDPAPIQATFRTSGTTLGAGGRGEHRVRDLSLYRASLLATATPNLRPELMPRTGRDLDGRGPPEDEPGGRSAPRPPLRVLALLPAPEECPDSSLVHMAGVLVDEWDDGRGGFLADGDWTLRIRDLERALGSAHEDEVSVLLLGTSFGYVHWLDASADHALHPLPPGSRVMETGGFKGRSRAVTRGELYRALSDRLGLPMERIVNEYGMTELLSQFYEPVLREGGPEDPEARRHVGPPWVRTRVLDPMDLTPLPPGEPGLLCHLDLANLDSVCAVLTEDAGVEVEGGFRVLGRLAGSEPRGCSLAMEELLRMDGGGGDR